MLEVLEEANQALDACGRPVAPPGYAFIDLPYHIPVKATFTPGGGASFVPFQMRANNNTRTVFRCTGIIFAVNYPIRVKWPSGRYLAQSPSFLLADGSPLGAGGNLLALDSPVDIQAREAITVEVSGG